MKTAVLVPDAAGVERAAAVIRGGGLVAFPTETVYGLGADALNPSAVARIFAAKDRPAFDPLIVHVLDAADAARLADPLPESARRLIAAFWPGPLTVVVPKSPSVPGIVTAGLSTVALRSPAHSVARALINSAAVPVAAPSANRFSRISPTSAHAVLEQLDGRIDLVLDAGPTDIGVESTIVLCTGGRPALLRAGGLPVEDIQSLVGPLDLKHRSPMPQAPGGLPRHYAPSVPLFLHETVDDVPPEERSGTAALLFTARPVEGFLAVEHLSDDGDLAQAASRLFPALSHLEKTPARAIHAESVPQVGLGRAIMERLLKAASPE
ncbi:MAG: threonylcarbamoyl-AMP synthase [Planctomycetes bacterium]|nr:threonylcarbamoyl-AMP synthase [Planctomycetota bacterium]